MGGTMITTVLLSIFLGFGRHQSHTASAQPATQGCSIHVVGFRFQGVEGQKFELAGSIYTVGKSGFVELLSEGETTYTFEGRALPLTVWPANEFSFLLVPLPTPALKEAK
jgi:hypothetical protein